jgi:hypothetical protein
MLESVVNRKTVQEFRVEVEVEDVWVYGIYGERERFVCLFTRVWRCYVIAIT